jgi:Zn-dependent M16 (insulinase) family peptidase
LKGVAPEKVSQVEVLIQDTLKQVVSTGFDHGAVEAALNTFDFSLREFSSASTNRGISFMNAIYKHWIFERDPLRDLRFEKPMQDLRAELQKPKQRYLQGLVEKYLLNNPHRLTVEAVPALGMGEAEEAAEKARLQATKSSFDRAALEKLAARAKELQLAQEAKDSPEAVATLPTLSLSDLDPKSKDLDISVGEMHGATYLTHNVASSGIVYVDVAFDATAVALEDLPLLPLLKHMMFKTGTSQMGRTAFEQRMGAVTGGLSASILNMLKTTPDGSVGDLDDILFKVMVHGKARAAQTPEMLDLLHAALTDAKLDSQDRALEYLKSTKTGYEAAFKSSGNAFANQRIYARRSLSGYIDEITGGLEYYNSLKQQLREAEHEWPMLVGRLERLRKILLNRDGAVVNVAADLETLSSVRGAVESFVKRIPAHVSDLLPWNMNLTNFSLGHRPALRELMHQGHALRLPPRQEGFVVPTQVNFVAQGGGLFKFGERVSGHDQVIVRYLSNSYMWDNVRVMGGAYGGSCSISPVSGTFMCSSYRDPNLENTLKVFNGVDKFLEAAKLNEKEIEPLIIGAVADLDKPMAPSTQGRVSMTRYLSGQTLEARQRRRNEMLGTKLQDFRHFAKQLEEREISFKACIFGSKAAFAEANDRLPVGERLNLTNLL